MSNKLKLQLFVNIVIKKILTNIPIFVTSCQFIKIIYLLEPRNIYIY